MEELLKKKRDLTASIGKAESIRDYGGMWKVNGEYLLDGARRLGCSFASMVDKLKTPEYDAEVKKMEEKGVKFEYINRDFREIGQWYNEAELDEENDTDPFENTEVSLLNDVLLHQDNFTEVVKMVCQLTDKYIVVVQPFYEGFDIPSSCAMIQFMSPEWKKKLWVSMWVDQRELDEFSVDIWMWAQSAQLMIDLFNGYGWKPKQDRGFTSPIGNDWYYTGIIFEKK